MIESRLLERIERKKSQLGALRPLPAAVVNRLREQILVEWIYNSNAIEGSTVTLQETRLILETGLTIGGKTLREHFEVTNHRDAIFYVEQLAAAQEKLTPFHVRQIHKLVLSQIDDVSAGNYRTTQVQIAGARHVPPKAWEVPAQMTEWGKWLVKAEKSMHPVVLAALAHHSLVKIHPFVDGNGRTARLVMNLILMQNGYPPTVILRVDRQSYYRVLSLADDGKEKSLVNFVGKAVERSLTLYLNANKQQKAKPSKDAEWLSLAQASQGTPYSQEYLSLLARMGRIEAVKQGRNWLTTREAIQNYMTSLRRKKNS
ncbi:MAG: Fic family protein [Anaerolineales bacterium]|nr:Fic family protein [Anaerolineales bacterium]MCL4260341.1 Fic family protein [Anaerolineales bacterium]